MFLKELYSTYTSFQLTNAIKPVTISEGQSYHHYNIKILHIKCYVRKYIFCPEDYSLNQFTQDRLKVQTKPNIIEPTKIL